MNAFFKNLPNILFMAICVAIWWFMLPYAFMFVLYILLFEAAAHIYRFLFPRKNSPVEI